MKKDRTNFFENGWKPIILWIISIGLLVSSEILKNHLFGSICFALFGFSLLVLLISAIYQLFQKKWLKSFIAFVLFSVTIFAVIVYTVAMFWIEQETPDTWAHNLKIPTNIKIDNPADISIDENKPDSLTNRIVKQTEFQLYNSFQPGLYEYDFWIGKIESGIIYLKAFEITQNLELSSERLRESSSINVYNPTDKIMKFGTSSHFTIYEGDWGDPYAGRFEVWFKPDNGAKERKLYSKNYKIEGWMR
ncbi:hypothetical protein [Flavobacterium marginilacus]|uniref:hypothetical protein n=1 Tax=Flavobacterium marginilacus TaxID=3003256 RepID=UPI00248DC711|nr:hypothetical protein [Flavobacterium marginilacus]